MNIFGNSCSNWGLKSCLSQSVLLQERMWVLISFPIYINNLYIHSWGKGDKNEKEILWYPLDGSTREICPFLVLPKRPMGCQYINPHNSERICPSGGSISQIRSRFRVGVRSFSWNWSVRNGGVLGESSTYFCEASRRLSTGREWDWHAPDACWHLTMRNMPQEFGFHSLLWFIPHFFLRP